MAQTTYPTSTPTAIVSPHFLVPYPVHLTIVDNLWFLSDQNLAVTDANGKVIFKVKSKSNSLHDRHHDRHVLLNAAGYPIVSFQRKLLSFYNRRIVFRRDSSDSKDIIFSVKRSSYIQFKTSLDDVFLGSNEKEDVFDFRVKGNRYDSRRSCTIYARDGTTIVAQMHKKNSMVQSIVHGKDTYVVTVYPNVDYAFIVALVVISSNLY